MESICLMSVDPGRAVKHCYPCNSFWCRFSPHAVHDPQLGRISYRSACLNALYRIFVQDHTHTIKKIADLQISYHVVPIFVTCPSTKTLVRVDEVVPGTNRDIWVMRPRIRRL